MNALRQYLDNHKAIEEHERMLRDIVVTVDRLRQQQHQLRERLENSVQPVCGSATKPHIRTYTDGTYTTVSVYWDDKLGRGRITVTANDETEDA